MSDALIIGIVTSVITLICTIFTGIMAYLMAQLKVKATEAAVEVKNVANKLDSTTTATETKLNSIAKVQDATHKLVNSAMTANLKLLANSRKRIADLTNDPQDIKAALEAREAFELREKEQAGPNSPV
jgi:uncharacterized membrane protein (UPF0182 family)